MTFSVTHERRKGKCVLIVFVIVFQFFVCILLCCVCVFVFLIYLHFLTKYRTHNHRSTFFTIPNCSLSHPFYPYQSVSLVLSFAANLGDELANFPTWSYWTMCHTRHLFSRDFCQMLIFVSVFCFSTTCVESYLDIISSSPLIHSPYSCCLHHTTNDSERNRSSKKSSEGKPGVCVRVQLVRTANN